MITDIAKLKKLWPYLRSQKKILIASLFLIPVIALSQMAMPIVLKRVIDEGIVGKNQNYLIFGSVVLLLIVIGEYIFRAAQRVSTAYAVHRMVKDIRVKLVKHVLSLNSKFHDQSLSGGLVTRATGDFDNLTDSLNQGVLTSVVEITVLIGSLAGLFMLEWHLALIMLVILPIIGLIVSQFSGALKKTMLIARAKASALNAFAQECLYGHTTIKVLTAQKHAARRFDGLNEDFRKAQMKTVMIDAIMFSLLDGLASVTVGVILWFSLSPFLGDTSYGSKLTVGLMVAFIQYIYQIFEPLKQLGMKMAMLQGAFTSIERIFGILDTRDFITGKTSPPPLKGKIAFENLSFSYSPKVDAEVLTNVNVSINAGQSLAIVGATGSGKSTLVKLLTKLYDGYTGKILIDDQDILNWDGDALRRQIAVVPQDIVLFDGTVNFNISLDHKNITKEQIIQAAKRVGADTFIKNLPHGYETHLKEQGSNLSHGQRQLLAFARAIVKDPKIVVLDEATSSIDPYSESLIQKAISKILEDRTVVIIAHRLSTIRKCNKIIVIDQGKVIEEGTHGELISMKGAFFKLHQALN